MFCKRNETPRAIDIILLFTCLLIILHIVNMLLNLDPFRFHSICSCLLMYLLWHHRYIFKVSMQSVADNQSTDWQIVSELSVIQRLKRLTAIMVVITSTAITRGQVFQSRKRPLFKTCLDSTLQPTDCTSLSLLCILHHNRYHALDHIFIFCV